MAAVFDQIASKYDKNRGGDARGQRFADALLPLITPHERVLDMGVGTGLVAGALQQHGCSVVGIDVSAEMLKHAADRVQLLVQADMNTLPFMDAYFGTVYAVWSLHMVTDMQATLIDIRRVLKSGGRLLNCSAADIVTSEPADAAGKILAHMQKGLRGDKVWHDRPENLERLASEAGFDFEEVVTLTNIYETSIAQMIEQIEGNAMLTLQMATPEQKRRIVQPALEKLRALPDHHAPIRRERTHRIAVLRAIPSN